MPSWSCNFFFKAKKFLGLQKRCQLISPFKVFWIYHLPLQILWGDRAKWNRWAKSIKGSKGIEVGQWGLACHSMNGIIEMIISILNLVSPKLADVCSSLWSPPKPPLWLCYVQDGITGCHETLCLLIFIQEFIPRIFFPWRVKWNKILSKYFIVIWVMDMSSGWNQETTKLNNNKENRRIDNIISLHFASYIFVTVIFQKSCLKLI